MRGAADIARGRFLCGAIVLVFVAAVAAAQELPPPLTQPVNDFAGVIDADSEARLDMLIRSLQQASGDVIVVAAVDTVAPYADIHEYAVKMFENRGRGIGGKEQDNGLLIVLAVKDRAVRVEVGYGLEEFVTDGFAGETSRQYMAPHFRRGEYGAGLVAGATRLANRIAERRNVTLEGVRPDTGPPEQDDDGGSIIGLLVMLFFVLNVVAASTRRRRRRRGYWGAGPWSGWHSGVGPFGGGFRGGFGGGGFGGGFGGFGGGGSGGGGGGASW